MTRYCTKLGLLVWKNWTMQVRHVFSMVLLTLVSPMFIGIAIILRSSVDGTDHPNTTRYPAFNPADLSILAGRDMGGDHTGSKKMELAWTTQEWATASFINESEKVMQIAAAGIFQLRYFSSAAKMLEFLKEDNRENPVMKKVLAGVVLADKTDPFAPRVCSRRLEVTLRFRSEVQPTDAVIDNQKVTTWLTNLLFPIMQIPGPRDWKSVTGPAPRYTEEGFAGLQSQVSSAVLLHCTNKTRRRCQPPEGMAQRRVRQDEAVTEPEAAPATPVFYLHRFSYPPYYEDPMAETLTQMLIPLVVLSFLVLCVFTVKSITEEKASQMKETLKMMGVSTSLHWIAWFIKTMTLELISVSLAVVLLKVETENGALLHYSSWVVLFVFLLLFATSLTFFSFMISVFFSNAYIAGLFAGLFYIFIYLFFSSVRETYLQHFDLTSVLLISLTSVGALGMGIEVIAMHEGSGFGQQWTNIWTYGSPEFKVSLGMIWLMLLLTCPLYMLIALYFEAVLPQGYGLRKPWNFLCKKSYWRPQQQQQPEEVVHSSGHKLNPQNFESEPSRGTAGVLINNVSKVFSGNKLAVNNLSLTMYEGEITVLLGHNGAGKTTTISMITGMTKPTSGSVIVGGYDIRTNTQDARQGMGLCPQHNVLFDELTVREHLYFFSKMKGLSGDELKEEIDFLLKLIEMEDKKNKQARTLSGGMKRKLAVTVALCGKSKVVFLDEPTAGMDPAARRALWDLLRELKTGRTLLLTTHMMDEADVLGDRIAIMAGGRLQCYGSPFFLKKRFSGGYHLVVVKGRECETEDVTKLLKKHIKNVTIIREAGFEIVYLLDEAQTAHFQPMLAELEGKASALRVTTFGVSVTTMEEVFLKVCKEFDVMEAPSKLRKRSSRFSVLSTRRLTGIWLLCNQVHAMSVKRAAILWRGWLGLVVHLIAPSVVMLFQYVATSWIDKVLPPRSMLLESYTNPKTVIAVGTDDEYFSKNYRDLVTAGDAIVLDDQESPSEALENYLLYQYTNDVDGARRQHIVGASFEEKGITGWFNDQPIHALPLALNMLYNAELKSQGISLNIVNYPLPYITSRSGEHLANTLALTIGLGVLMLSGYFILLPIKERSIKAKHNQIISGVNVVIFWGVNFIFDFLCYVAAFILLVIVLAIIQVSCCSTAAEIGRTFTALICFACGNLPFIYVFALMFTSITSGYASMLGINLAGWIMMNIINLALMEMEKNGHIPEGLSNTMKWIFYIIPLFTLMDALLNLGSYCRISEFCSTVKINCSLLNSSHCCPGKCPFRGCVSTPPNYLQWLQPGVKRHLYVIFIWGLIFWAILLLIDSQWINCCIMYLDRFNVRVILLCKKTKYDEENLEEDEDVLNEKRKISSSTATQLKNYGVALSGVTKYYRDLRAVNDISLGVEKGESFGLLGINGAGKTSTFKIMTGDTSMTKGKGYLMGYNIQKEIRKVHKNVGYCPQFDALIDVMTVRETLRMYFLLKGCHCKVVGKESRRLAQSVGLTEHLDKKVKDCSGGNKRKLSLAIALIGDPPVVFLDEPTAGMDPGVRRLVWDVVMDVRDFGASIILTSHSMEECEVLCTRLAIMINGSFKCLGPIQHLKNKFAEGYILIIKVKEGDDVLQKINAVKQFVSGTFPDAALKQEYLRLLTYNIPSKVQTWSQMFGIMEKAKKTFDLEDYYLGQTTLEQVFLHLTSLQKDKLVK